MRKSLFELAVQPAVSTRYISLEEEIQANIEQTEAVAEVDKTGAEIQHAEDAAAVLEDLATVVDKIDEPSPTESALIQITGDALAAGTDADPADLTPSMEDEGGTKNFGQKAKETIRRIIEAIKAAFRRMWEWVKKFFTSTNSVIDAKAQRSKELREKLRKVKFDKPVELKMKGSKLFDKDMKGSEVASRLKETFKALQQYREFIDKTTKAMETGSKTWNKLGQDLAKGKAGKLAAPAQPYLGKATGQKKDISGLTVEQYAFEIPNTGLKVINYKLSGNVELKDANDFTQFMRNLSSECFISIEMDEAGEAAERTITIAAASELEAGLAAADASLEVLKEINKVFTEAVSNTETGLKALETEANAAAGELGEDMAKLLGGLTSLMQKAYQSISSSSMRVVKAVGEMESTYLALAAQATASVG